tara:strand:+ start:1189 stop:2049 length:861 start_codon:yes stop_codon:yes gene_type:complete
MSQKMNEKTNNLMSRHEEIKKVFLQVGSMFGLPNEIIKTLYLTFKYSKEEELQKIRIVYNNLLLLRTLYPVPKTKPRKWSDTSPPKLVEERVIRMNNPAEPELEWIAENGLDKHYNNLFSSKDIYREGFLNYRIPIGRGSVWSISTSINKKHGLNDMNKYSYTDIREKLMLEIKILGERTYLFQREHEIKTKDKEKAIELYKENEGEYDTQSIEGIAELSEYNYEHENETLHYYRASRNSKILYLNTNSYEEIYLDYNNYNEWKGFPQEYEWCLVIEPTGDTEFIN